MVFNVRWTLLKRVELDTNHVIESCKCFFGENERGRSSVVFLVYLGIVNLVSLGIQSILVFKGNNLIKVGIYRNTE